MYGDCAGPFPEGTRKERYFILFVDSYTGQHFLYTASHKSEALEAFKTLVTWDDSQNHTINELRTDNGGEWNSQALQQHCAERRGGTEHWCHQRHDPRDDVSRKSTTDHTQQDTQHFCGTALRAKATQTPCVVRKRVGTQQHPHWTPHQQSRTSTISYHRLTISQVRGCHAKQQRQRQHPRPHRRHRSRIHSQRPNTRTTPI